MNTVFCSNSVDHCWYRETKIVLIQLHASVNFRRLKKLSPMETDELEKLMYFLPFVKLKWCIRLEARFVAMKKLILPGSPNSTVSQDELQHAVCVNLIQLHRNILISKLMYLQPESFSEVFEERAMNQLCGWPLCSNPPSNPKRASRPYVFKERTKPLVHG